MTDKTFFGILLLLSGTVCLVSCEHITSSSTENQSNDIPDSIVYYINQYKNSSAPLIKKKQYLQRAYNLSQGLHDTLKFNYLTDISNLIYDNDSILFKKINAEKLALSTKLKDTLRIGKTHYLYGHYYYYVKENLDSAYYFYHVANKSFTTLGKDVLSGEMLYTMACIKNDLRDYTGSEKLTYQAIKLFNGLNKKSSRHLYYCHNLAGINFQYLKEFDKSLLHHLKALEYLDKTEYKDDYQSTSFNNIGKVYEKMGEHTKAIEYFQKGLMNETLKIENPRSYARLLDNLAYNKFKNNDTDTIEISLLFKEALKIRDSLKIIAGIATAKRHLAEYYSYYNDTLKAITYAKDAETMAKSVDDNGDRLKALKLLAKLDKANAGSYLETYIRLNDSIHDQERAVRNKSTRIEYETDGYIAKTERLTLQNILMGIIGGALVLVFGLLYFIKRQRAKTNALLYEQEQQRANEEIYSLISKQQAKLEEGRKQERHRISEELHDGILGKLFGTRVGLGFFSIDGKKEEADDFKSYLEELQTIEKEIRDVSHALKNNILRSDDSFVSVIEQYVSTQGKIHGFNHDIHADTTIPWDSIDDKLKVILYRIIQESVQNMVKHAHADTISIIFNMSSKFLHLKIKDDGKGFDIFKKRTGIGLKNMESRILKYNGTFTVDSNLGEGTTITIRVLV
ncbi:sensor histidine kinase [Seonamhaeicola sp.]|uniref:tetratricopeptide repeat-containing sensor histidine kinase n=1 Tax=Seonamhaeicola sp. TaxID=1912245 RepID=UPI002603DEC7|nr:sensor histidine kinase [Seonamhaeicola sp.]